MGSCQRVPYGFPSAVVRHGCHCTLLLRGRQSSLGMAQGLVLVIHVGTAGGLSGHAHFRQVFPYCSDHIPRIGFGMSDVADIPKPLVGKGLSSLTMNRSNLTLAAIPMRTHSAHCKRHVGRVGIAGMLCHHLFSPFWLRLHSGKPFRFTFEKALGCHVREFLAASHLKKLVVSLLPS